MKPTDGDEGFFFSYDGSISQQTNMSWEYLLVTVSITFPNKESTASLKVSGIKGANRLVD